MYPQNHRFRHHKVFRQASAYTCLVFLGNEKKKSFEFDALKRVRANSLNKATFSAIPFSDLKADKWRLAKGNHLENLKILNQLETPLVWSLRLKSGLQP